MSNPIPGGHSMRRRVLNLQRAKRTAKKAATTDEKIDALNPGRTIELSRVGSTRVIAERTGDGKRLSPSYRDGYRNGRMDRLRGLRLMIDWADATSYGNGYRDGWYAARLTFDNQEVPHA
jgi:hypothetical protein